MNVWNQNNNALHMHIYSSDLYHTIRPYRGSNSGSYVNMVQRKTVNVSLAIKEGLTSWLYLIFNDSAFQLKITSVFMLQFLTISYTQWIVHGLNMFVIYATRTRVTCMQSIRYMFLYSNYILLFSSEASMSIIHLNFNLPCCMSP